MKENKLKQMTNEDLLIDVMKIVFSENTETEKINEDNVITETMENPLKKEISRLKTFLEVRNFFNKNKISLKEDIELISTLIKKIDFLTTISEKTEEKVDINLLAIGVAIKDILQTWLEKD